MEPGSSGAYYNRALALVGLDRFSDALDDLERAASLSPTNTDARWMRFKIESELREAARRDTTVPPPQRPMNQGLASVLTVTMMGELDKILEIDKSDIWALNERGRLKHEKGEYDKALADYNAALALCDTCTWLLYNKALTLRANWQTREARAVLKNLISIDSSDGEAWLMLGDCEFALGMRREACVAFQRSMDLGVAEAEERYETLCR